MRLTKKETVDYMIKKLRKIEEHYNEVINIKSDGSDALCERKISAERDYVEYKKNNQDEYRYVKLGQLEDIEEELGIDLITLWKAINNRIFIRTDCNYHFVGFDCLEQDSCGDWYWDTVDGNFYLKDYGRTWALTKEELL